MRSTFNDVFETVVFLASAYVAYNAIFTGTFQVLVPTDRLLASIVGIPAGYVVGQGLAVAFKWALRSNNEG